MYKKYVIFELLSTVTITIFAVETENPINGIFFLDDNRMEASGGYTQRRWWGSGGSAPLDVWEPQWPPQMRWWQMGGSTVGWASVGGSQTVQRRRAP